MSQPTLAPFVQLIETRGRNSSKAGKRSWMAAVAMFVGSAFMTRVDEEGRKIRLMKSPHVGEGG
jgi:hypothetical protein